MSYRRHLVVMAAASGAGQLALIVSGVIAARGLGPADRGVLALLVLMPSVASQLALSGVPSAVTYFTASDHGESSRTRRTILRIALMQILVVLGLLFVAIGFAHFLIPNWTPSIRDAVALLLAGIGLIVQQYGYSVLQGHDRFVNVAFARVLPSAFYAIFAIGLFAFHRISLATLLTAWSLANFCAGACALAVASSADRCPTTIVRDRSPAELLNFGARAFVGNLAPLDTFRIDHFIGGLLLSPTYLGFYVVAQAFSALPKIVAVNTGLVVYTNTARNQRGGPLDTRHLLLSVGRLALILVLACVLLFLALPMLNHVFFGAQFDPATSTSRVLVIAAGLASVRRLLGDFARGLGAPGVLTWTEIALIPAVIAVAIPGCDRFGEIGLGYAVLTAQAFALALILVMIRQLLRHREIEITEPKANSSNDPSAQ